MKRILSLILLAVAIVSVSAQDAKALYKDRYSYDLKQDRISIPFDGRIFWLRASYLKDDSLTLVFNLKDETPQTATETVVLMLPPSSETMETLSNAIISGVRSKTQFPPDVTIFNKVNGTEQRILTFLSQDPENNLLEDSMFRFVQTEGKRLMVALHTRRVKLDQALKDPAWATSLVGDHRAGWLLALNAIKFPF